MAMKRRWTPEMDEYLRRNYGRLTAQQIGDRIGISASGVLTYACRHGIPGKPGNPRLRECECGRQKVNGRCQRCYELDSSQKRSRLAMRGLA